MKRRTLEEIAIERIGREAFAKIAKAEGAPAALRAAMHRMLAEQHQERALDWGLHHAQEPMTDQQHPTREELAAQLETVTRERDEARYVLRHASAELEDKNPRLIAAEKELLQLRRDLEKLHDDHTRTRRLLNQASADGRRMHAHAYRLQDAKAAHEKDLARLRTALARVSKQLERYAETITPPKQELPPDE